MFGVHIRPTGEEEQDVADHTHKWQKNQSDPQTLGKTADTHSDSDAQTTSDKKKTLLLLSFKKKSTQANLSPELS